MWKFCIVANSAIGCNNSRFSKNGSGLALKNSLSSGTYENIIRKCAYTQVNTNNFKK